MSNTLQSQENRSSMISAGTRILFGSAVFVASFLLFLVEPVAAKQLVPIFGGSSAVWITCLVFFQTALLAGYGYAHWLTEKPQLKRHYGIHLPLLLAGLVLAILWAHPHAMSMEATRLAGNAHPVLSIFTSLSSTIGLPFLLLAATSPLLQIWYARINGGKVPYRLFALSNLASLLALGLYPTLIEPTLTLRHQREGWCAGFALFAALIAILVWRTRPVNSRNAVSEADKTANSFESCPTDPFTKMLWLLLPLAAAMQLSAITSHLTENIAAIPLLWILPLATYLLTLVLAFEFPRLIPRAIVTRFVALMLASLGYMLSKVDVSLPVKISVPFYLVELFAACLFCHSAAYALRPPRASETTSFYLMFAAGGALGSFVIGIACPLLFSNNYDLALSFIVTALLALVVTWHDGWAQRLLWSTGTLLLMYLVFLLHAAFQHNTLLAARNFYGSLRVEQKNVGQDGPQRTLMNGTIRHGMQIFSPTLARVPTTYYAQDSGVGLALRFCCEGHPRNIGVVGLGVGTIAAYGHVGDRIRFYEINPAVLPIAQHLFTYLRDSSARITYAPGDARFSLAREAPRHFDVLAIDAFSGDAIPLHLLTREAMNVYQKQLAPNGILAFHVSNQYVDLEPEVSLLAKAAGMQARTVLSAEDTSRGEFRATWVLVTSNAGFFANPGVVLRSTPTEERKNLRTWTDDYSSLLPIVNW